MAGFYTQMYENKPSNGLNFFGFNSLGQRSLYVLRDAFYRFAAADDIQDFFFFFITPQYVED